MTTADKEIEGSKLSARGCTSSGIHSMLLLLLFSAPHVTQKVKNKFAVIKKMADIDFTTMLCEPELVMITARTVLFAYINLGINNIYLTNFMVLMLCLFGYLFKI